MGLDLSARAAAAVTVPIEWDGKWTDGVKSCVVDGGEIAHGDDMARARRTIAIAERIVAFASEHGVTVAWIEGYAFSQSSAAHTIAEVGGVVRAELLRAGIEVRTAMMQSARKLLLGKVPRAARVARKNGIKDLVADAFKAAGLEFGTLDEYDAMAVLNWGQAQAGRFFYGTESAP